MRDLTAPALLDALTLLVSQAAAEILRIAAGALAAREKSDATPVTAADEASEAMLLEGLARLVPGIDIISEEAAARAAPCKPGDTFILVDPLDGTRELVAGRDEYTINVAIIKDGRPVTGLLASPARGLIWRGAQGRSSECLRLRPGDGPERAERKSICTRPLSSDRPLALVSRSHLDADTENFLARWPRIAQQGCGSALKFGLLAQGEADLYPRLAPTSEWDIAAGDAILTGAGGLVLTPGGTPVRYGQSERQFRIPAFIAWGDAAAARI
jgi:3'(2'), 5'-bisphosphate nucleotidase